MGGVCVCAVQSIPFPRMKHARTDPDVGHAKRIRPAAAEQDSLYLTNFLPELRAIVRDLLDATNPNPWNDTRDRVMLARTCRQLYHDDKPGVSKFPRVWQGVRWPLQLPDWIHRAIADLALHGRGTWPTATEVQYVPSRVHQLGRGRTHATGDLIRITWSSLRPTESWQVGCGNWATSCSLEVQWLDEVHLWSVRALAHGRRQLLQCRTLPRAIASDPLCYCLEGDRA